MFRKAIMTAVLAVGAATIFAGPAVAMVDTVPGDMIMNDLPGPGVLGLITIGIIGAVVIAKKWRRK